MMSGYLSCFASRNLDSPLKNPSQLSSLAPTIPEKSATFLKWPENSEIQTRKSQVPRGHTEHRTPLEGPHLWSQYLFRQDQKCLFYHPQIIRSTISHIPFYPY